MEIWKDIEGYEGLYQVSNLGRVRTLNKIVKRNYNGFRIQKQKILKQSKDRNGYLNVKLQKDKNKKMYLVHRLVAKAFVPNPKKHNEIHHIIPVKYNECINTSDNLEWCTHKENCNKHKQFT